MAEATTEPVGRYVQIAVDTPDNVQSFALVKETSTSNFNAINPSIKTHSGTGCTTIQIVPNKTSSEPISDEDREYLSGLGYVKHQKEQYSIITDGSTYRTMMTANESGLATNRHFEPVEVGVKPIDFDENKTWKYYTKRECNDHSLYPELFYYRNVRAGTAWNSETQYYQNTTDFHHYYVIDGQKKVRLGIGDLGLYYNKNMSQLIAATNDQTDDERHSAFWTFLDGDTTTSLWEGTGSIGYNVDIGNNVVPGVQNLFSGMSRYLFDSDTYNSHWRSSVTEEQKGQWRTSVHNNLVIKNVTLTQFGFVNHGGHRYFGVWAFYPEAKYYVGYQQYPVKNDKGTGPYTAQTSQSDLRTYDFSKPIPNTETPRLRYFQFYGVDLDALEVTLQEKEGQMPPDVNPDLPEVKGWTALKPILPTKRSLGSLAKSNQPGFHVWDVTEDVYKQFLGNLWNWGNPGANVWEQLNEDGYIKNPIAGITGAPISIVKGLWESAKESKVDPLAAIQTCFALPGYINTQVQSENDSGNIKVAGLNLGNSFNAYCCNSETYVWDATVDCSGLGVTQSYLDTAPYSTAEVYLPYIGMVQINPADCLGGSIDIRYSTCVVDGTISATIVCHTGLVASNPTQYGPYTSNAAYRIPIAQKDANAFDRSMGYMSAIGTGLGGVFNVVKGSLSTLASNPRNQNAIMDQGLANIGTYANSSKSMIGQLANSYLIPQVLRGSQLGTGSAIVCNTREVAVIVSTPLPVYDGWDDSALAGFMSGKIGAISTFSNNGNNFVSYSYAKLDNITATAAEIEDIKSILYGGVYQ